ncbi:MAG: FlgD immunoglobulin-like domain containing protein [Candidatus Eisenbacteria bacterium]
MSRHLILAALAVLIALPSGTSARRRPPDVYPLLYQPMKSRLEKSDFALMARYDVVEVGWWGIEEASGNLDSLRAIRTRNPDLVVLSTTTSTMQCVNWATDEVYNKYAWAETLDAHPEWLLRDVDGDLFLLAGVEETCDGGRLNYYHPEAARAFARFLAEATVLYLPDDLDGIMIDDLQANIYYYNGWGALRAPGVDSLDLNQDGIADTKEQIDGWWSAGVDTFLVAFREVSGPDVIVIVNGYVPEEAFPYMNGRYHEGFPWEHGDDWDVTMLDAYKGFLGGDTLYSDVPHRFAGLLTNNASPGYNYDPDHLSTKEAPFPHVMFPRFLNWTLSSFLLGEGWYAMTGWGNSVDWNGERIQMQYQTLWWFPVYDTLKSYLGTPVEDYVYYDTGDHLERYEREFTGGRVRSYRIHRKGIFDLRPRPSLRRDPPAVVAAGETVRIAWDSFDPNGENQPLDVILLLSDDGGTTFPETLGTFASADTSHGWVATGPPREVVFRVAATDTSDLTGFTTSPPVTIAPPLPSLSGVAEVKPTFWIANTPALLCTLFASTSVDSGADGWNRAKIVLPADVQLLSFAGAERDGLPLPATATVSGDTVTIDPEGAIGGDAVVGLRLLVSAPALPLEDSLRFAVSVDDTLTPGGAANLPAGDGNGIPGDGDVLTVACDFGPPVALDMVPEAIMVSAGDTTRFETTGLDAAGNAFEVTPLWSVTDTLGTVDDEGLFRAIRPGSLSVVAEFAGLMASAPVSILPGAPHEVVVQPESVTVSVEEDSVRFTARVYDGLGNLVDSATPVWSVEDTIARVDGPGLVVPLHPGETGVTAEAGGVTGRAALRIEPGAPATIVIEPDSVTVTTNTDSVRFTATVYDAFGNPFGGASISWAVEDTIARLDGPGLVIPLYPGATGVTAELSGITARAGIRILSGSAVSVAIVPESVTVTPNVESVSFSARAYDVLHYTVRGAVFSWTVEDTIVRLDGPGVVAPLAEGRTGVAAETDSASARAGILVESGAPVSVIVEPESVTVTADADSVRFTATAYDVLGHAAPGAEFSWTVEETLAVLLGPGLVAPRYAGEATVAAEAGGVEASAALRIEPGAPASIVVEPESVSVTTDTGPVEFAAFVYDALGNLVPSAEPAWAVEDTIAIMDGPGIVIPLRPGETGVTAAVNGVTARAGIRIGEGAPYAIVIEPDSAAVTTDADSVRFTAFVYDALGNPLESAEPVWAVEDTIALLDGPGLVSPRRPGETGVTAAWSAVVGRAGLRVDPGAPATVAIAPQNAVLTESDTLRFHHNARDRYGNLLSTEVAWSLSGGIGVIDEAGLFTAGAPGEGFAVVTAGEAEASAHVVVLDAPVTAAFLAPAGAVIDADSALQFQYRGITSVGDTMILNASWSILGGGGSIDEDGLYLPGPAGEFSVVASKYEFTDTASVAVLPGAPRSIEIEPPAAEIAAGGSLAVTARVEDAHGNLVSETAPIRAEGLCEGPVDGLFTCTQAGDAMLVAEHGGLADTAAVTIVPGPPAHLAVQPASAELFIGETLFVSSSVSDGYGNPLDTAAAWEIEGGSFDSGRFVPGGPGPASLVARLGPLADTCAVTVRRRPPASITVSPGSASLVVGGTFDFQAFVADEAGSPLDTAVAWEATGETGTVSDGRFTATGAGEGRVIARLGSLADSAEVIVTDTSAPPPPVPGVVSVHAFKRTVPGSEWLDPLALSGAYHGEGDDTLEAPGPESLTVILRPLGDGVASCVPELRFPVVRALPDTFSIPLAGLGGLGGCGLVEVALEVPGGAEPRADTIRFGSPDLSGDLRVGLADVAAFLAAWNGAEASNCADVDGDGALGRSDLAVIEGAFDLGCGAEPAGVPFDRGIPNWYSFADAVCDDSAAGDDSVAARFLLEPAGIESLRALEITFPSPGGGAVEWSPTPIWTAPRVTELPSAEGEVRVLLTEEAGLLLPRGSDLVEVRICGMSGEEFTGSLSKVRVVGAGYEASAALDVPILLLLDTEDTTGGRPDTTEGDPEEPLRFALHPNRPNPFRGATTIRFSVPAPGGDVRLSVYNLRGEEVAILRQGEAGAGVHAIEWDGRDRRGRPLAPGLYFVRFVADPMASTKKIVLLP